MQETGQGHVIQKWQITPLKWQAFFSREEPLTQKRSSKTRDDIKNNKIHQQLLACQTQVSYMSKIHCILETSLLYKSG